MWQWYAGGGDFTTESTEVHGEERGGMQKKQDINIGYHDTPSSIFFIFTLPFFSVCSVCSVVKSPLQNTNNPTIIHAPATSITTAVYPTISRALTLVIANNGSAQKGWSMLVS